MNNFTQNYKLILEELRKVKNTDNFYFKPIKPRMSDIELIALNLTAEYMSIDSEHQIFRVIKHTELDGLIERTVFNRRKRKLFPYMENIRQNIASKFNAFENYFVMDSMPLEVAKLSRSSRSKICKEHGFLFLTKVIVLLKNNPITAIRSMQFVPYPVYFKASILHPHPCMTLIT